jgi:CRP/FNR family cyclic AMP-dependent transcriptional regulator
MTQLAEDRRLVRVLDVDPELGHQLSADDLATARRYLVAEVHDVEIGQWYPHEDYDEHDQTLALLLLDGLLTRRVQLGNSTCAELLGQGDVLRPWQEDRGWGVTSFQAEWSVLQPARLAILDWRIAKVCGRWPELMEALLARSVYRSRCLAFHMAISHLIRVDVRLRALFWFLADRWGRVSPDGVVVPLELTHATLAHLVGAQRPSVTTALGQLAEEGRLTRRDGGAWVVHGEPPQEMQALRQLVRDEPRSA